ncbi:hypothetical protein [Kitasatospora phosalacinea]|uniref:Uncharacterized protein n=1 Tax=Kitasatospora phosalacinea TaxID=2065 RepID=A0A9W6PNQ4_9ACTN|nr:hypothetical protein [Kitasatospora phosalacinea]GLW58072.1 hypothetical protein Kpho01_60830 [Kitasatospora phosalacinea]
MDSAPQATATAQMPDGAPAAPKCARPGCEEPLPPSRTRPRTYCSRACRSKVDHAKAKARKAAAEAAAPSPAPAPGPAATAPAVPAVPVVSTWAADGEHWGEEGQRLLGTADALRRKLTNFLLDIEAGADPVAAFKVLTDLLPSYSTRLYRTAEEIRDRARWPDADPDERIRRRMMERIDLWDEADPDHPDEQDDQGEQLDQDDVLDADGQGDEQQPVQAAPAAPRRRPAGPLAVPQEPYLRGLGKFDRIRDASRLMDQHGWDLAGWTRAPGVYYVRRLGRALAWIEHGVGGRDGWVVVVDEGFVADPADRTQPLVLDSESAAALVVRQALEQGLIDFDTAPTHT